MSENFSAFVGRQAELANLAALAKGSRIVTLVGPGGVGKTRLGLEYLRREQHRHVSLLLDQISTEATLVGILAEQLGLEARETDELRVSNAINRGQRCVFLDNAEHVLEGALDMVDKLAVPFVVTSRIPLGHPDEKVVHIEGLSPSESLELLTQLATRVGASVEREQGQALVDALDGLPLAIELASSKVRVLDASQILERVQQSNRLLSAGPDGEQTTLDGTILWSWEQLSATEQALAKVLSLREDPLDPQLAEALVDGDVLEAAAALERQSWIRVVETPYGRRWTTLFVLRRFASGFVDDAFRDSSRKRLVDWSVARVDESPGWWAGYVPEGLSVCPQLVGDDFETAGKLLNRLFFGAFGGAFFGAVLDQAEHMLVATNPDVDPKVWGTLATKLSKGAFRYRGAEQAIHWAQRAVDVLEPGTASALGATAQLVLCLIDFGRRSEAEPLFESVMETQATLPRSMRIVAVLLDIASAAHEMGRFEALRSICQTVIDIGRNEDNADAESRGWTHMSYASYDLGDFERARGETRKVEALLEKRHPHDRLVVGGVVPALVEIQLGDPQRAKERLVEAYTLAETTGNPTLAFFSLLGLVEWANANDSGAVATYLDQALEQTIENNSSKSRTHVHFLQAIDALGDRRWEDAADRLGKLRLAPAPANPEQWKAALDGLEWLLNKLSVGSPSVQPDSTFGQLLGCLADSLENRDPQSLHRFIASVPSATWAIPGLYFFRFDAMATQLAERLSAVHVLRLQREGLWFEVDGNDRQDMRRRAAARRILMFLVQSHQNSHAATVTVSELVEVGWPDELITHDAALARVYTTLNRLRAAGLSEVIETRGEGYAIASTYRIAWED